MMMQLVLIFDVSNQKQVQFLISNSIRLFRQAVPTRA